MEPLNRQASGWVARVGLEVHAQLNTRSKLFCACRTDFGGAPNSQTCPVCLGLPGALPVLNAAAVICALRVGVALGGRIARRSAFARKNYFYPDVPKNYQITQYDQPLVTGGWLEIATGDEPRQVAIARMHLEEDAGKLLHDYDEPPRTRVDYNRAGVPLLEIVTAPELHTGAEARDCVQQLRQILLYLDVCDGNLQEGSLRCDANVSIHRPQDDPIGRRPTSAKVEIKNLNSFRAIQQAVDHEIARQQGLLARGRRIEQQTRGWDANAGRTVFLRTKEWAHDYRYFPEPDLPPLVIDEAELVAVRSSLPELPAARVARFLQEYSLPAAKAAILTETPELADYFEATTRTLGEAGPAAHWIVTELLAVLNAQGISLADFTVSPEDLAGLLALVREETISGKIAKAVFAEMVTSGQPAREIVQREGWEQTQVPEVIDGAVREVLDRHPDAVQAYLAGKERVFTFLVGQVMQATGGRAHPGLTRQILRQRLQVWRDDTDGE